MILQYPPTNGSGGSIEIRDPELGDTQEINHKSVNRRTIDNELDIVRDENWARSIVYTYEFTAITQSKIEELRQFLIDSAGLEISITDYENVTRNGVILTPVFAVTTDRDTCSYSFSLSFRETIYDEDFYKMVTEDDEELVTEDGEPIYTEFYP